MGADLIGYFAIGPRKLDAARSDTAIEEADRRLDWLRKVHPVLDEPDPSDNDRLIRLLSQSPYLATNEPPTQLESIDLDQAQTELHQLIGMVDDLDTLTGKIAVDRVFRGWPPSFRDSAHVVDPDTPDRVIVFAGERTWGDTPEGGGFRFLGEAAVLGVAESFGIHVSASFFTLVLNPPKTHRSTKP